jgi:hypothetical protein
MQISTDSDAHLDCHGLSFVTRCVLIRTIIHTMRTDTHNEVPTICVLIRTIIRMMRMNTYQEFAKDIFNTYQDPQDVYV